MIAIDSCQATIDTWAPGKWYVITTQGCLHKCKGCPRPHIWSIVGGTMVEIDHIIANIQLSGMTNIVVIGGEPMIQTEEVTSLITRIKEAIPEAKVFLYTVYTLDEIVAFAKKRAPVDTLITTADVVLVRYALEELTTVDNQLRKCQSPRKAYHIRKTEDGVRGVYELEDVSHEYLHLPQVGA